MQIRSIKVNNFKSLVDFEMDVSKFTCLIGLNGAGKSTVLQFVDFLAQLVRGDMNGWLEERKWKSTELRSKLSQKKNIEFCIGLLDEDGTTGGEWEGQYSPTTGRCTTERIDFLGCELHAAKDRFRIHDHDKGFGSEIAFSYEGSILSALKGSLLPQAIIEFKRFFQRIESRDTLTPERLRQRTRSADGSLGHGGKNLSAFLYELGLGDRKGLAKKLKKIYPQLKHVYVKSLRSGWKQLHAYEQYRNAQFLTEARHLNDGMLRLLAIFAEVASNHSFVLFDEIENGINPEVIEFVLDALVSAPQQVLVTTHSPMILNYLEDDVAREGVVYLYKTRQGNTQSIRFFDIPSIAEKLTIMGPGEAFADTDLTELHEEIEAVAGGR